MKIFWPYSLKLPSGSGTARVRTAARSEPACGSVRFIVPVHSPATIFGRYLRLSSSLPLSSIASIAPWVSIGHRSNAMFDACHISSTAAATSCGRPWPPNAGLFDRPFQPCSTNFQYASRNPGGVTTEPSSWRTEPRWSPGRLSGSSTSVANFPASSRIAATVSGSASVYPGSVATCGRPASSFMTNRISSSGARYVLTGVSLTRRQRGDECGQDLEQVADQAVVGDLEDRRLGVLVDRDDHLAVLHAGEVLDRAGDPDRDVEVGRDDLAGLPDLVVVRDEARVDGRARRAERGIEPVGERLEQLAE